MLVWANALFALWSQKSNVCRPTVRRPNV